MTRGIEDDPERDPGFERITEGDLEYARKLAKEDGIGEGKALLASEIDNIMTTWSHDPDEIFGRIRELLKKHI